MNKKNKVLRIFFNVLYVVMIIAVILGLFYLITWTKSQGGLCVRDPINFYMNMSKEVCYCGKNLSQSITLTS